MSDNNKLTIPYPWQTGAWEQLRALHARGANGILLFGPRGTGKVELARYFARSLLCRNPGPDGHACGACLACRWSLALTHPDLYLVRPEAIEAAEGLETESGRADSADGEDTPGTQAKPKRAPSKDIRIEQVRVLGDALALSSHQAGERVVVMYPADALNLAAANALLKLLEEPPEKTLLVLVCDRPERLLPTIVSRCQRVVLTLPPPARALAWLESQGVADAATQLARCGGSPLAARDAATDPDAQLALRQGLIEALCAPGRFSPLRVAERLAAVEPGVVAGWLLCWVHDCISYRLARRIRYHPDESARLAAIAARMEPARLIEYQKHLMVQRRVADHPLNKRLFAESLLLGYSEATQGR